MPETTGVAGPLVSRSTSLWRRLSPGLLLRSVAFCRKALLNARMLVVSGLADGLFGGGVGDEVIDHALEQRSQLVQISW
jgi:hypothetical protein